MSGLETLAQVYREMEAPKLSNLKKTAVFIFLFAFILTVASSFLAVSIIPDAERPRYLDNLLGGLAMFQEGPKHLLLLLQAFVVVVGAMILSGAVNTSLVGANSVLSRVAEDGILADWFRWLHPKYGTTHRTINLVAGLQVGTILFSRGNVYSLGEAYAFGHLWSFVFLTASIILLRFKDRSPREWMVPLNISIGTLRFPVGLILIFLVLLGAAGMNLFTKNVATVWGGLFTLFFYGLFKFSEKLNERHRLRAEGHREKVNLLPQRDLQGVLDDMEQPHKTLVALRDHIHMFALKKVLETAPDGTEIVVLHARRAAGLRMGGGVDRMSPEEELFFTQVISLAEKEGKSVLPVLVSALDPILAIAQTAQAVGAEEVVMGASNIMTSETQIERLAMAWGAIAQSSAHPVKVIIWRPDGGRMEFPLA
jgi:hypothetical protein